MFERWYGGLARVSSVLGVLTLLSACKDQSDDYVAEHLAVRLIPHLEIQGLGTEYQFYRIADILVTEDAFIWVVDGLSGSRPIVRRYGPDGEFLQEIGRVGNGPGEYVDPIGLAAMKDGRLAVRDGAGGRVIIFSETGDLDATWTSSSLGVSYLTAGVFSGSSAIAVDTSGIVWLPIGGRPSIEDVIGPPTTRYLRVSPSGVLVDSLVAPQATIWPEAAYSPDYGRRYLPRYQPRSIWGWSPSGTFATARTDEYRIEILPPPEIASAGGSLVEVSREVPPVAISGAEREYLQEQRRVTLAEIGQVSPNLPEEASQKPLLREIQFSDDNRLMVLVSLPSVPAGDGWREPSAYDVFDQAGGFLGRIVLPQGFYLHGMRGDLMWGVAVDDIGVESVVLYRLEWP